VRPVTVALTALCLYGAVDGWLSREVSQAPGILAPEAPRQALIASAPSFAHDNHSLTPRAHFDLTARILAAERYHLDKYASLMPRDIAFGWGSLSDTAKLETIRVSQSGRFAFWRSGERLPDEEVKVISSSFSNMHLIPANDSVRNAILRARVGQIVMLSGRLVDVKSPEGWSLPTSLTRDDTGPGACEVVFVETFVAR